MKTLRKSAYPKKVIVQISMKDAKPYKPEKVLSTFQCHDKIVAERSVEIARVTQQPLRQEQGSGAHRSNTDFSGISGDPPDTEMTNENSQVGTKVRHSALCITPVLLTATALYRYTSIGFCIRKLGGVNRNSIREMNEFSSYTQESRDMLSDSGANYISHQPI
ncbi:PIR Superfamily Protein [Plasmodium ovale curtisi]|uniref:PIR Superfamily Protein n=1 Tax=Plasmodium ovale curtisi TaxID=864141 RepID=A0A1A8XCF1_PLAOA|nr:PIR Superfamily Protein [Plasmodium ovale curtisi]SBT02886.1 PIR Superfamily Protein [Plasmodium ovale curtisi]